MLKTAGLGPRGRDPGVLGQLAARVEGEGQTVFELKYDDRALRVHLFRLELGTGDAVGCRQAHALPVKAERLLEVVDGEGNDVDAWLHGLISPQARRQPGPRRGEGAIVVHRGGWSPASATR